MQKLRSAWHADTMGESNAQRPSQARMPSLEFANDVRAGKNSTGRLSLITALFKLHCFQIPCQIRHARTHTDLMTCHPLQIAHLIRILHNLCIAFLHLHNSRQLTNCAAPFFDGTHAGRQLQLARSHWLDRQLVGRRAMLWNRNRPAPLITFGFSPQLVIRIAMTLRCVGHSTMSRLQCWNHGTILLNPKLIQPGHELLHQLVLFCGDGLLGHCWKTTQKRGERQRYMDFTKRKRETVTSVHTPTQALGQSSDLQKLCNCGMQTGVSSASPQRQLMFLLRDVRLTA